MGKNDMLSESAAFAAGALDSFIRERTRGNEEARREADAQREALRTQAYLRNSAEENRGQQFHNVVLESKAKEQQELDKILPPLLRAQMNVQNLQYGLTESESAARIKKFEADHQPELHALQVQHEKAGINAQQASAAASAMVLQRNQWELQNDKERAPFEMGLLKSQTEVADRANQIGRQYDEKITDVDYQGKLTDQEVKLFNAFNGLTPGLGRYLQQVPGGFAHWDALTTRVQSESQNPTLVEKGQESPLTAAMKLQEDFIQSAQAAMYYGTPPEKFNEWRDNVWSKRTGTETETAPAKDEEGGGIGFTGTAALLGGGYWGLNKAWKKFRGKGAVPQTTAPAGSSRTPEWTGIDYEYKGPGANASNPAFRQPSQTPSPAQPVPKTGPAPMKPILKQPTPTPSAPRPGAGSTIPLLKALGGLQYSSPITPEQVTQSITAPLTDDWDAIMEAFGAQDRMLQSGVYGVPPIKFIR